MKIRGFTLIEIVIVTALTAVIGSAVAYVYGQYNTASNHLRASVAVTEGGSAITRETRYAGLQATRIVSSHYFLGTSYTTGTTTVIFELPSIDRSGNLISGYYDYIGIHATGTKAYRLTDSSPSSVRTAGTLLLTESLSELSFEYDSPNISTTKSLFVDATTTAQTSITPIETHVRAHIYMRNSNI